MRRPMREVWALGPATPEPRPPHLCPYTLASLKKSARHTVVFIPILSAAR